MVFGLFTITIPTYLVVSATCKASSFKWKNYSPAIVSLYFQYGGPMPGMPQQGMAMGGHMGGPPTAGYYQYAGGYPGTFGAPQQQADPMYQYFTAIAGQVRNIKYSTKKSMFHTLF